MLIYEVCIAVHNSSLYPNFTYYAVIYLVVSFDACLIQPFITLSQQYRLPYTSSTKKTDRRLISQTESSSPM